MPEDIMYADPDMAAAGASVFSLLYFGLIILMIVGQVFIFKKAGKKWWEALIPVYNLVILLEIVKREWWWLILLFVPFVNIVALVIIMNDLSKAFGHGVGFTLGLIFLGPIFMLILAFGSSQYVYASESPAVAAADPATPAQPTTPAQTEAPDLGTPAEPAQP